MISVQALKHLGAGIWHRIFVYGQRVGVDILPRHFYSSIPDLGALQKGVAWRRALTMAGVAGADPEGQLAFLERWCGPWVAASDGVYERACGDNGEVGYGPIESQLLFSFIASVRPRRVIQVGAGVSTNVILQAAAHAGFPLELICVDPFPTPYLRGLGQIGHIKLISMPAQEVPLSTFMSLTAGDCLFVDSTHSVKVGSEVNTIILEVLPKLAEGVYIHFHDIHFPYDYQPSVLQTLFFSSESSLLHAYLADNSRCRLVVSMSMLHHCCPERLSRVFPRYHAAPMDEGLRLTTTDDQHYPSAAYLQRSVAS